MQTSKYSVFAVAVAFVLSACGNTDLLKKDGGAEDFTQFSGTYTLQGKIMDAVTGSPVGGSDLQVKLIQGTTVRDPDRLARDDNDPMQGEYAYSNIPLTTQFQASFKLVVIKPGYLRFETVLDNFRADYDTNLFDTVFNFIGNIYLYPTGTNAPDYAYNVSFNGKPVPDAVVYLDPTSGATNLYVGQSGYRLTQDPGHTPAMSVTTDASGRAVFAGSTLALGVTYSAYVLPTNFEGVALARTSGGTLVVGGGNTEQYVAMTDAALGANAYGLYVSDISNRFGALNADGVLTISFSRAVYISNLNGFTATLNGSATGVLATPSVTATLSADGRTLTLRPNWTTRPGATEAGVSVDHAASATIGVVGYPGTAFTLFGLTGPDNATIDNTVWVSAR